MDFFGPVFSSVGETSTDVSLVSSGKRSFDQMQGTDPVFPSDISSFFVDDILVKDPPLSNIDVKSEAQSPVSLPHYDSSCSATSTLTTSPISPEPFGSPPELHSLPHAPPPLIRPTSLHPVSIPQAPAFRPQISNAQLLACLVSKASPSIRPDSQVEFEFMVSQTRNANQNKPRPQTTANERTKKVKRTHKVPASPPPMQSSFTAQKNQEFQDTESEKSPKTPSLDFLKRMDEENVTSTEYEAMLRQARDVIVDLSSQVNYLTSRIAELSEQKHIQSKDDKPLASSLTGVQMRIGPGLETVWYADRAFPAFDIELVDADGTVRTDLSCIKIELSVIDGFGTPASNRLSPTHPSKELLFKTSKGVANIHMFRFNTVSSKCGGHFKFVFTATDMPSLSIVSPPIQVLSYRLYHSPKLAAEKLQPSDSILKMRGIGTMYAKRLNVLGVKTVKELAALDLLSLSELDRSKLMEILRKDRGALTMAKLKDHIQLARDIMARFKANNPDPPAKRQCLAHNEKTVAARLPPL